MPYYAIAIGREQKVTEDWLECQKLTKGFSGAKFKRFNDNEREEAEKYIEKISIEFQSKILNNFETEQKLIPAFTNQDTGIKNSKTELYIGSDLIQTRNEKQCPKLGGQVFGLSKFSLTVNGLISTRYKLNQELDTTPILRKGDSTLNNYYSSIVETDDICANRQLMYLDILRENLKLLKTHNIKIVNIFTDSNYLLLIMQKNILNSINAYTSKVKYHDAIEELYDICYSFSGIYLNYYSGSLIPDKLKYLRDKAKDTNLSLIGIS